MFDPEQAYNRLCLSIGEQMARFVLCAALDKRFDADSEAKGWTEYASQTRGEFASGPTDVNEALMAGMDQRELWDSIWGDEYGDGDCRKLDELFRVYTGQFDGTGGLNMKRESCLDLWESLR